MGSLIAECVRFGWETFWKRPPVFLGAVLVVAVASWLGSMSAAAFGEDFGLFVGFVINMVVGILIGMGEAAFFLKAEQSLDTVSLYDLWHPQPFWKYVGATALAALASFAGLLLLIVPGIIISLMFMFSAYIVISRALPPLEALKESRRITKGNLWPLLGLVLTLIAINILGFLALFVGLLVSMPVSMLALVRAYRTLEQSKSEPVPAR